MKIIPNLVGLLRRDHAVSAVLNCDAKPAALAAAHFAGMLATYREKGALANSSFPQAWAGSAHHGFYGVDEHNR